MKSGLCRYFARGSVEYDQPLLEKAGPNAASVEFTEHKERSHWSIQKIYNGLSLLYLMVSLPFLLVLLYRHVTTYTPYSPVNHRIEFERQPLYEDHDDLVSGGFIGNPKHTEANWRRLLEPMNFRATANELAKAEIDITDDIVRVSGGGYVGVLSVFHELHCLDALRKSTLRQHYYPNLTADHDAGTIEHLTHCIEYIRRTVQCHADTSIYAARWIADSHAVPNKDLVAGGDRVCVGWEGVDRWSRERMLVKKVYRVKPGPYEVLRGEKEGEGEGSA